MQLRTRAKHLLASLRHCAFALLLIAQTTTAEQMAKEGKWAEAEQAFIKLEQIRGVSVSQLNTAIEVSSRLNNWTRVVQLLTNFRRRQPLTFSLRLKLYEAELRAGDRAAAEKELASLARQRPNDQQLVHLLAFLYLSQDRLADAANLYTRYLKRNSSAIESHINLALIDFKLDRGEEALSHLKQGFAINPREANAYFYRQLVRNMPPEGLADLAEDAKKELGLPQDGLLAHLYLAREYENLKRYDNAISEYDKYLQGQPEDEESRFALAKLYSQTGDTQRSEAALSELLKQTGRVGDAARLFAAELAVKGGDMERASQLLSMLPESYRTAPSYRYLQARVAISKGDHQAAETLLQQVIAAAPEIAEAYFHLGQLYLRTGRTEKGRELLAEFERKTGRK
jgi:tetratricopeptide (TPR) repeat protein